MPARPGTSDNGAPMYPIFVPKGRSTSNYRTGYINKNGIVSIAPVFDDGTAFHGGFASVKLNGKWGFIDHTGATVVRPRFDRPGYFESGVAAVGVKERWGVIDENGKFIVEPKFHELVSFSEGMSRYTQHERGQGSLHGFINRQGHAVIPAIFPRALSFSEGLAAVELDRLWGFITPSGVFEKEPSYSGIWNASGELSLAGASSFHEGLARVWTGKENAYIDKSGAIRFTVPFAVALSFSDGRAVVRQGENSGFIDVAGNLVTDLQFSMAHKFSDGMSSVEVTEGRRKLWGIINKGGNWLVPPRYLFALEARDGLCFVETEKSIGYVNASGDFVWEGSFVQYRAFGL
jgi:hypothetical protein